MGWRRNRKHRLAQTGRTNERLIRNFCSSPPPPQPTPTTHLPIPTQPFRLHPLAKHMQDLTVYFPVQASLTKDVGRVKNNIGQIVCCDSLPPQLKVSATAHVHVKHTSSTVTKLGPANVKHISGGHGPIPDFHFFFFFSRNANTLISIT